MVGRTQKSIGAIVRFLIRYIGDQRFTRVLVDVTNTLLDVYEDTFDQFTGELVRNFLSLQKMIRKEEQLTLEFLELQGVLDMIIAASSCGEQAEDSNAPQETIKTTDSNSLLPSESARVEPIINV